MVEGIVGSTLGHYHVLDKVGQGGMTSVYKSLDLESNQVVALKVLSPFIAQDPAFKARFEREIQVLLKLRHENIVPILDYGEDEPYAYIVMPFIAAGTLQDRLRREPLSPYEGARLVSDITAALAFAHEHGIVHRDVKPSNILLPEGGGALLSDFGFAHIRELSHSLTGSALIGTPAYMSPEQCTGGAIDERSDQYSLGVVLYQLCTGKLPFDADTPMALAVQHINEPLLHPRRHNSALPEPVANVLIKALSKDPEHRYSSIERMNKAFQDALESSVDAYGNFLPQGAASALVTWVMERTPLSDSMQQVGTWWRTRRRTMMAALLLLLALPSVGYALARMQGLLEPRSESRLALQGGQDAALQATIDALSTELAASGLNEDLVQAAIAGTMSSDARTSSGRATPTPGYFETLAAANNDQGQGIFGSGGAEASSDGQGSGGNGSGGGSVGLDATPTPTPTAIVSSTANSTPAATSTPTPPPPTATFTPVPASATPLPTATQAQPTATDEAPGGSDQCRLDPHPAFPLCTSTPEP